MFNAIPARQCTRGDYDGKPLSSEGLDLLERAGASNGVRILLLTERPATERVLEYMVQGNTAQMADPAFGKELETWIRFNGTDAVRTRDGLFSVASGNPAVPKWLGDLPFGWFFTTQGENDKYARQIRSSAGAAFVGQVADMAHWVEVGRCAEAAWYPTALLPSQGVRWQAVDDASANATIVDGPITLTLLFRFNEAGLIASVRADSRSAGAGKDMVMLPWDCGLSDYQLQDGMLIPMAGEAAWIRPEGRKAYFVGKVKKLNYEFD